jgi:hypothetical protein
LRTLPPAKLKKFEKGQALPFIGYSLVQWVSRESELWQELSTSSQALQEDFGREGIEPYFYFLPGGTFHAAVQDVLLGAPPSKEHLTQAVCSAFDRIQALRKEPPRMEAEDLTFMGESSFAAILPPVNHESLSTVFEMRAVVAEELERYRIPFTRLEPSDFFGHITLAYPVSDLPAEVYGKAKALIRARSREAGLIGELVFDEIQLRRFDSMVDWSEPLETLRWL